jgi:16S rRNA (cytosine967-C5)-methyltransferase
LKIDKTRLYACKIITAVRFNGAYLNKRLQHISDLPTKDMALLTSLCYGVIKNYDYLKTLIIRQQSDIRLKRPVEVILVLAFYQFLLLDKIPSYAIIDTAVDLTKQRAGLATSRFVNAFLHQAFANKQKLLSTLSSGETLEADLALRYSMPLWLIKLLLAQYGADETTSFLTAVQLPAQQFIRVNKLRATAEAFAERQGYIQQDVPYCFATTSGTNVQSDPFLAGKVTVQNISSQAVGYFVNPQRGDNILDMCAAPGGKATHLAELTGDMAHITALEMYGDRVLQIEENQRRLGINSITALQADATDFQTDTMYDKILLDAPCSGLGTLAQKPEIRYHLQPTDLDALVLLQRQLIDHAWTLLKNGGELIYSTCTINRKENERQVSYLLEQQPTAQLLEERLIFDEMREGYAGFYMAKISKRK